MKVRMYLSGNPVHDRVIKSFYDGCPEKKELVKLWKYEPSDVAVIFGVRKTHVPVSWPRGEIFRQQREKKLDVVVLETGYINRGDGENHHYAAGLNGLNGRADFKNKDMPELRKLVLQRNYGLRCLAWRDDGKHILLCGQVPWDASVDHINYTVWLHETARKLLTGLREVRYRPHPLGPQEGIPGCSISTKPIREDFEDAWATVAFNSNSVVESVIEGIPGFSFDSGSMASEVCNHWLDEMDKPRMPDRHQWLNNIAYAQWTPDEMRSGDAWRHLFKR
jgi:hypothetical protein